MPAASARDRSLAAQLAAHEKWAQCPDRSVATAPARNAFNERFVDAVDPDRVLALDERARRAEHARKSYFLRLALRSAQARRKAAVFTADAEAAESELESLGGDAA